jgi:DNA-binding transcriptional LysR family regulator
VSFDRRALEGVGILDAVVSAGSFVGAGAALGLTQSAVSRAVTRIEARVGVRIFERSARAIALTDAGRRFYAAIAPHLAAIAAATREAGAAALKVRGRLRVNVDAGIGQLVLGPHLAPFLAQHPDLVVELVVRDRLGDLVSDGFDAAVRFGIPRPSALKARLLLRSRIVTCAAPAYLARRGVPRTPRDIERHDCIHMRNPVTGSHYAWEFVRGTRVVVVNAGGRLMVNQGVTLTAACLGGLGIAQLLDLYVRQYLTDGRLVQVLPRWADETYPVYVYHSPERVSAKLRAFLEFVATLVR